MQSIIHPSANTSNIQRGDYKERIVRKAQQRPPIRKTVYPQTGQQYYQPGEKIILTLGQGLARHEAVDIQNSFLEIEKLHIITNPASLQEISKQNFDPTQYESFIPDSMLSMFAKVTFPDVMHFDSNDCHYGYQKRFLDSLVKDNSHSKQFSEGLNPRDYSAQAASIIETTRQFGTGTFDANGPQMFPLGIGFKNLNYQATTAAQLEAERKSLRFYGQYQARLKTGLHHEVFHIRKNVKQLKQANGQYSISLQDLLPFSFKDPITGQKQFLMRELQMEITLAQAPQCLRPSQINIPVGKNESIRKMGHQSLEQVKAGAQQASRIKFNRYDQNLMMFKMDRGADVGGEPQFQDSSSTMKKLWNQNVSYRVQRPRVKQRRIQLVDSTAQHKIQLLRSVGGQSFHGLRPVHYIFPLNNTSQYQQFDLIFSRASSVAAVIAYIGPHKDAYGSSAFPSTTNLRQLRNATTQGVANQATKYLSPLAGLSLVAGQPKPASHSYPLEHNWRLNFPFNEHTLMPYIQKEEMTLSIDSNVYIQPDTTLETIKRMTVDYLTAAREKDVSTVITNQEWYSNKHFVCIGLQEDPNNLYSGQVVGQGGMPIHLSYRFKDNTAQYSNQGAAAIDGTYANGDLKVTNSNTVWGIRPGAPKAAENSFGGDTNAMQQNASQRAAFDFKSRHAQHIILLVPYQMTHYQNSIRTIS